MKIFKMLIKWSCVVIVVGACIGLGIMQWSLFQQQKRIEISIHGLEEQRVSSSAFSEKTLNELHLNIEKQKSSTEETLKEINKKYQADIALLQTSFDEIKNAQNELETFFKEKMEIVFEEINIIKSKTTESRQNSWREKYQEVNKGERDGVIDLLSEFTSCIELRKFEKLRILFSEDAICIFNKDVSYVSRDEYIDHIKNIISKFEKIRLKPREWAILKHRDSGNYHLRVPYGYSFSNKKHEENGLMDCFIKIKHQGTKLKIDYIEEKISDE